MTRLLFSRNDEIYDLLSDRYTEFTYRLRNKSSVNTDKSIVAIYNLHITRTIRKHTAVVQEFTCYQKTESLKKLCQSRMTNHRHVKQAVIRHRTWSLTIPRRIAYAHCHNLAFQCVVVYFQLHTVFHPLEYKKYKRNEK